MAVPAPVILLPTAGADYATDVATQTLSGTTSTDTHTIWVNGATVGVSYTAGDSVWSWTGDVSLGENTINIIAVEKVTLVPSVPATIKVTLVVNDQFVTVSQPTGVRVREYQDKMEAITAKNPEAQTVGYNFYVSTRSGGIDGVYAKINPSLVNTYSFYETDVTLLGTTTDTAGNIRVTTVTEEVNKIYYYSAFLDLAMFSALVAAGKLDAVTFSEDTPFFFVVSAVIYDPISGQVTESAYSVEMQASPLVITTGIRDLPARTQSDVILTFNNEILGTNKGSDLKPGTVARDMMDPASEEMARVYVIQDFLARSLSVSALLDYDDANGDGTSDPVSTSPKKQALQISLNLTDPVDVQRIINDQFDKLASNVNVIRKGAVPATGTVVYYVEASPVRDMYVYEGAMVSTLGDLDAGIASQNYQTTTSRVMSVANKDSYYNSATKRYELEVEVQAVAAGSAGNTDSYTIKTVNSGADSDFLVENPNPIAFGADQETNHQLGGRIQLALYADTGTEGGYVKTTIAVQGVRNVRVEKAGDPLMIRDWDSLRLEHVGGKVDIYVQGERSKQVSDQIAFAFAGASSGGAQSGETFQVINAVSYQFKTTNTRVTAHTPIFEVSKMYNATRGQDYDIAGYVIIGDGDTVQLNSTLPVNVAVGLASADVIKVDYRYRSSDTYILSQQPVTEIISVVGQLSGPLPSANWEFVSLQDRLEEGGSTIAKDGVRIIFAGGLPVVGSQTITNESHVMVLGQSEPLRYLGADPASLYITDAGRTTTYVEGQDYRVTPGTDTVRTTVELMESGAIYNGQQVLMNYTADENFIITYSTNALLGDVQTKVDKMKHACADAIAKQAVENKVDIVATVIPKTGVTNQNYLTQKIRTAVSNYVAQLDVGASLTQSEVVKLMQSVPDVSYVILPFNRMIKADGSFVARDDIGRTQFQVYNEGLARSFITAVSVLSYKTVEKGGPENLFRGVFQDGQPLVLQSDPLDVSGGAGRAYIQADGKLVVSTKDGLLPDDKNWSVAYYVYGETGAKDINVNSVEYLTVGNFTIIYGEPMTQAQVL